MSFIDASDRFQSASKTDESNQQVEGQESEECVSPDSEDHGDESSKPASNPLLRIQRGRSAEHTPTRDIKLESLFRLEFDRAEPLSIQRSEAIAEAIRKDQALRDLESQT